MNNYNCRPQKVRLISYFFFRAFLSRYSTVFWTERYLSPLYFFLFTKVWYTVIWKKKYSRFWNFSLRFLKTKYLDNNVFTFFPFQYQVKSVLKKKFNTLRENRTLATRCTKTSIGWANEITIQKDQVALTNGNRHANAYDYNDRPELRISDYYSREDVLESEKMLWTV